MTLAAMSPEDVRTISSGILLLLAIVFAAALFVDS